MKSFKERVALITGAGSGIGKALALELSGIGMSIAANDIRSESLTETAEEIRRKGGKVFIYKADISKETEVEQMIAAMMKHFGRLDLLVNNAGVTIARFDVEVMPSKWWHRLNDVNFNGPFYCTKHCLPHLKKSDDAHIVNISSAYGLAGVYDRSAYCAAKFGLRGFSEALNLELLQTGIGVTIVYPGSIDTNIAGHSEAWSDPLEKARARLIQERSSAITPGTAANKIIRGVRRNKTRVLIGFDVKALDFMVRLLPARAPKIIHYFLRRAERRAIADR